jgi:hypothetical protein
MQRIHLSQYVYVLVCYTELYMRNADTKSACWKRNCWYRFHSSGPLSLLLETEHIHDSWLRLLMKGGDRTRFHICTFKSIRESTDIRNLFVKPCALVMKRQCKSLYFHVRGSTNLHPRTNSTEWSLWDRPRWFYTMIFSGIRCYIYIYIYIMSDARVRCCYSFIMHMCAWFPCVLS